MEGDKPNQMVYLMDFVQDFRREEDAHMISIFEPTDAKIDALLAATVESLCLNSGVAIPKWVSDVEVLHEPYFVAGIESIKAITIVESPVPFRRRNIFVLSNFLTRV
jgi:hypothetical protein